MSKTLVEHEMHQCFYKALKIYEICLDKKVVSPIEMIAISNMAVAMFNATRR